MTDQPSSTNTSLEDTAADLPSLDVATPSVRVDFGAQTHIGKVRKENQDHFLVAGLAKALRVRATSLPIRESLRISDERAFLMVVADGMGGEAVGEQASSEAVLTVEDFYLNSLKWFLHVTESEQRDLAREFRRAVMQVDQTLIDKGRENPWIRGLGTTLTMAFSLGPDLYVVHAGDSRAYLLRNGRLDQLTADHTLAQMLLDGGFIDEDSARRDRRRHILTNVIGGKEAGVKADIHKCRLENGDVVLLCTDGLTGPVPECQIAAILTENDDPQAACQSLIDEAIKNGGPDNITAVVARFSVLSTASDPPAERATLAGLFVNLIESHERGDTEKGRQVQAELRSLGWSVNVARS